MEMMGVFGKLKRKGRRKEEGYMFGDLALIERGKMVISL